MAEKRMIGASIGDNQIKNIKVDYAYDALGRVVQESVPHEQDADTLSYPHQTETEYDLLGRPVRVIATDLTWSSMAYTIAAGQFVTTTVSTKQVQGVNVPITTKSYADAWGRVVEVEPADGPGVSYAYDNADRLLQAQYGQATTVIQYDIAGRKTRLIDPDMGTWNYGYDASGNLKSQTDANGATTCLAYDGLNRLSSKSFVANCPETAVPIVTFAYDGLQYTSPTQTTQIANQKGYRTGMLDASGFTNWNYDARGRLSGEQKRAGTLNFQTNWAYNSADLVTSMTYPADENGAREVVSYSYNPQKQINTLTGDAAYVEGTQYDEAGRVTRRAFGARAGTGEPVFTQYQYAGWQLNADSTKPYNSQGRLESIRTGTLAAPGMLQDLAYRYDIAGNVTNILDASMGPQTQAFSYDALGRILTANATGGNLGTYTEGYGYYPDTGNLAGILHNGAASVYAYNNASHPHAVSTVTGAGPRSFVYDANGNMTTRVIGADTYQLSYDAESHLTEVKKNNVNVATFIYNGDGQMATSFTGGVTTTYVGGYYEWHTAAAGSAATKYYTAGSARVAMRQLGAVTYLFGDHLSSTSVAFDDAANTTRRQGYTAFGAERYSQGGDLPTRYQYTGQRGFEEVGLYYYGARWYDNALGRFAQADTIIPQPGNPMAWDRFAYTLNNPIRYTDPSGHRACDMKPNGECVTDPTALWRNPTSEQVQNPEGRPGWAIQQSIDAYVRLRDRLYSGYGDKAVARSGKIKDKYFIAMILNSEFGIMKSKDPAFYREALEAVSNQYYDDSPANNNMLCKGGCTINEQITWASDVEGIYGGNAEESFIADKKQYEGLLVDATLVMNKYRHGSNDSWMWGNVTNADITIDSAGRERFNGFIITAKSDTNYYNGFTWSIVWGYPMP